MGCPWRREPRERLWIATNVALILARDIEGVVGLYNRCLCSDGGRQTLLVPPSKTMSEPIMNELSPEANKRR
jgi:hypothetical protein